LSVSISLIICRRWRSKLWRQGHQQTIQEPPTLKKLSSCTRSSG